MPLYTPINNQAFASRIDLSILADAVQAIRGDSDDVLDVMAKVTGYSVDTAECQRCGVERPVIEVDGEPTCLICKTAVAREYDVIATVTFTVRHSVMAASEDDAERKFRAAWDNGDVDTGDMDDAEAEVDRVEVVWR